MKVNRGANLFAAALLASAALIAASPMLAQAKPGAPPYCVKRGGPRGPDSVPQLCRFFDYQQCLQAAADLHGNCVVNIDYSGDAPMPPRGRAPHRY
jgi:hypothetical protein